MMVCFSLSHLQWEFKAWRSAPPRQLAPKYSAEETASAQVIALNTFESFKMRRSGITLKIIICCVFFFFLRVEERTRAKESELRRRLRTVWRQRQACIVIRSMSFLCLAEIDLDFAASSRRRRFEIKRFPWLSALWL